MICWNAQGRRTALGLAVGLMLGATGAMAVPSEEELVMTTPNNWTIGHKERQENYKIMEYIPRGESIYRWTRMLTVHIFAGTRSFEEFMTETQAITRTNCHDVIADTEIRVGRVNNYSVGMLWIGCPGFKDTKGGEFSLYYGHRSRNALYVVQRTWRGPAFNRRRMPLSEAEWREWIAFLQSTFVCDRIDSRHPCRRATPVPVPKRTFFSVGMDDKDEEPVDRTENRDKNKVKKVDKNKYKNTENNSGKKSKNNKPKKDIDAKKGAVPPMPLQRRKKKESRGRGGG